MCTIVIFHLWSLYTHSNNVFTICDPYEFKSFQISSFFFFFVSLITVKSINIKYELFDV